MPRRDTDASPNKMAQMHCVATQCLTYCNPRFASAHCRRGCECLACSFCAAGLNPLRVEQRARLHASALSKNSSSTFLGRWDCNRGDYFDASRHRVSGALARPQLQLRGKWLLLLGDSTMRMVYHLLLGHLLLGWERWPTQLSHGHGPDYEQDHDAPSSSSSSCLDAHIAGAACIEDAPLLELGTRLTMLWTEYGDDDTQLAPLRHLANATLGQPDIVVLGIGGWWAWNRPKESTQFVHTLTRATTLVDVLFSPRPTHRASYFGDGRRGRFANRPRKLFAAIPNCGDKADAAGLRAAQLNSLARAALPADWSYLDRETPTRRVCDPRSECAGTQFTARFHPSGRALNAIINMLLAFCRNSFIQRLSDVGIHSIHQKSRNFKFHKFLTLSNEIGEIPRNCHQNLCEIR